MAKIYISPAEGKRVRDPNIAQMPLIGPHYAVDDTDQYWFRRLRDGDVVLDEDQSDPPEAKAPRKPKPTPPAGDGSDAPPAKTE